MAQYLERSLLQLNPCQLNGLRLATNRSDIAVHFGRLAQEHIHGHVDGLLLICSHCLIIGQYQLTFFGGDTDNSKGASLTITKSFEPF